jgi:large subunit ribosomal protein L18
MFMAKAKGPTYGIAFRRRRENRTNYAKRLALVKSGLTRMVVRSSKREVTVQFVEFGEEGDTTVVGVESRALKRFGWVPRANVPTAYLAGLYAATLAKKKGMKEFVLDIGLVSPVKSSIPFAAQKGAIDGGLASPQGEGIVDDGRMKGAHIEEYAKKLGDDEYRRMFASYLKEGLEPREFTKRFEQAKEAILKGA